MCLNFKNIILFVCLSASNLPWCKAQDTNNITKKIIFVKEIPSNNKENTDKSVKKTINFFLGKKSPTLKNPVSVVTTQNGILWIADRGFQKILKFKNGKTEIPKAFKKDKNLSSIIGLCIADNKLLFTDSRLNSVFSFNEKENTITIFNKTEKINQPTGIAYSPITKEIWVSETAAHRISVFDEHGKLLKTIGKRGKKPGEFNYPTFIWIDNSGIIYVVDSLNFRIQIFDKNGKLIRAFGKFGDGTGCFARPKGIAVDSFGNIYVADALFHAIQIFDKVGNFLYSFGSQGRGEGKFWMPAGIFIDKKDNIYVADTYNSRIQIFKLITE